MDKKILQLENRNERKQILKDSCVKTETFTYPKQFTPEELSLKKDELSQQDIQLDNLEGEKKKVTTEFNNDIKELKNERKHTLTCVRTGMEEVTEQVFLLDDQEVGKMGYYNESGILVYERPLMPEERQLRISKDLTGTNN
ncbi:hypothetical protein V2605_03600 [Tenacibaculum maritimum]|uniref:hypothetical protein n=1 Tax=Tenacibaculum maritimum TaxID=107401 RepID=UPI0012E5B0EC|nr:hypothetical protein [Tenacibaculum maritimum]CAA0253756.1 conserved hypothetical protein [Tenacibaculum maritimum]